MIIDLHCHTKATKRGDGRRRCVDADTFVSKVNAAGVGIVAITNHNAFDLEQYKEFALAADGAFQVWPGVELDVSSGAEGSHWHMIVVCSPSKADALNDILNRLLADTTPNDCLLQFAVVRDAFSGIDSLFISHCHNKKPYATEAELREIFDAESGPWNYFFEPRTLVTVGIMASHGWNMMLGSDVKDWSRYPDCELPQLRLPVDSFEQFVLLAKRDRQTIQTMLGKVAPTIVAAHPHPGVDVRLPIFKEVNVLFGQKGTGKSEIAKSLLVAAESRGLTCSSYLGNQKLKGFETLLKTDSVQRDPALLGREDFIDVVDRICAWEERLPVAIDGFIDWAKTEGNSEKKSRFTIAKCPDLVVRDDAGYKRHSKKLTDVKAFVGKVSKGEYDEYLGERERVSLITLLGELEREIAERRKAEFIDRWSGILANKSLLLLKNEIDKKSCTKSMPGSVGYISFAQAGMSLDRDIREVNAALEPKEYCERSYLGRFDDKGAVNMVTCHRLLGTESKTGEFKLKITDLRTWKSLAFKLRNSFGAGTAPKCRLEFSEFVKQTGIKSLADFIGVRRFVEKADTGEAYEPSDGEKGILLLEQVLNKEADWYVLDEPEAGMSNSYIDRVIRPLVTELGKAGKTVVIATHNANLAVRTLPYSSIYREHQNGQSYRTYVGNPFIDRLANVNDPDDFLSWSEKSMEVLEGGEEAFFERMRIYKAGA